MLLPSPGSEFVALVQIYTTSYCPFCVRAKLLLKQKGVDYEELDVTSDEELREKMIDLSGGRRTVPEIFINGKIVGGYEELKALDDAGELDQLLSALA
jgi:glutaredoxin 3